MSSRILVVDDTPANIQALAAILREKGYQISVATNGKQALEVLARVQPDLILLDVMMPEMDGFEAVKTLRSKRSPSNPPVIFLSAKSSMSDVEQGLKIGGFDYITKPFSPAKLLKKVQDVFERMEIRKKIQQQKKA